MGIASPSWSPCALLAYYFFPKALFVPTPIPKDATFRELGRMSPGRAVKKACQARDGPFSALARDPGTCGDAIREYKSHKVAEAELQAARDSATKQRDGSAMQPFWFMFPREFPSILGTARRNMSFEQATIGDPVQTLVTSQMDRRGERGRGLSHHMHHGVILPPYDKDNYKMSPFLTQKLTLAYFSLISLCNPSIKNTCTVTPS